jgi:hypothetical protein
LVNFLFGKLCSIILSVNEWPRQEGEIVFSRQPLNFASLLAELGEQDQAGYVKMLSAYK